MMHLPIVLFILLNVLGQLFFLDAVILLALCLKLTFWSTSEPEIALFPRLLALNRPWT